MISRLVSIRRAAAFAAGSTLLFATADDARAQVPALASVSTPPGAPPPATASAPRPFAYGILVGTNMGGAGQTELRYAEDDARHMADVLNELGRYG